MNNSPFRHNFDYELFPSLNDDPVRFIYRCLDTFVLFFGLGLNALLAYLICRKTVAGMKKYKKLLLISCAMDLIVSAWNYITQPIPCVEHGYRTVLLNSWFRNGPQGMRYALYLVWIQLLLFFLVTTMSQYVCRYCILCCNGVVPRPVIWSLIFLQLFLNIGHACILAWADYPRDEEVPKMVEMAEIVHNLSGIRDIKFTAFGDATSFRWLTHIGIMCVIFPCFYSIIGICFYKIRRAVNEMNVMKQKEYNKQISAALLFQALLPTFEIGAWCLQIFVPMFMHHQSTVMYLVFSDVPIHLVPVLNPIGTILLVAPYRRALYKLSGINVAKTRIIHAVTHIRARRAQTYAKNVVSPSQSQPKPHQNNLQC